MQYNPILETEASTVVAEYTPVYGVKKEYQSEAELESDFIKQLVSQGYEYSKITNEKDLILNLKDKIERLNNYKFSSNEWETFFSQFIASKNDSIAEKTRKIQESGSEIFNLKCDNGETKNIYIIDKRNIHNNYLQVINQYEVKVEILLYNENMWLTQAKMGELYGVQKSAISKHLKNIFESEELQENSVVSILETTASDGKKYNTKFYNLDAIIAVGYRVNSSKATMFRIWANQVLKEYIIKGYVMNDERLKNPEYYFGKDYFEEQLERIRDIRSSERRFYQKITDIYSKCSADYDVQSETTKNFFSTVQNKLHFAITHQTTAEIVYNRADHKKQNMGLTTWKNAPNGEIRKTDVTIVKNYFSKQEISDLNEIVTIYLDYAERQAKRGNVMYMEDWIKKTRRLFTI